jgi:putative Mg2+ transporter-C (MgtC) family protein
MVVKVLISALFGLLIGVERRGGSTGPGMRTFVLICMGSTLFTVISVSGFPGQQEPSRLAAQIVTGIGFLGAGVIWRQKEEAVRGITTAASIWVAAAVGIAVGVGYYSVAFLVSLVTMIVLSRGHPIQVAKENLPTEIKVINESY